MDCIFILLKILGNFLIYLLYNGVKFKKGGTVFMQARFNHKIEAIAVSDIRQSDMEVSQIEGDH